MRLREEWLKAFKNGLAMAALEHKAPMLARALGRIMDADPSTLSPVLREFRRQIEEARHSAGIRDAGHPA
jgi:hypothetical protein